MRNKLPPTTHTIQNAGIIHDKNTILQSDTCCRINSTKEFKFASINARSIVKKLPDLVTLFDHAGINICCISETWQKDKDEDSFDTLNNLHNISWISRKRPGGAQGGGAAVAVSKSFAKVEKLEFPNPENLEVVWALLTPYARPNLRIITCAFYSSSGADYAPPRGAIQDYVLDVMEICEEKYPKASYIISGDINNDVIEDWLAIENFEQHVMSPTRGDKILDITVSDLPSTNCVILPPP